MAINIFFYCEIYYTRFYGAFTLPDTDIDTETETDTDACTLAQNPVVSVLVSVCAV